MARPEPPFLAFPHGGTLFLFEGDLVRVFGHDGTEATFPVSDLEAFLAFLATRTQPPEPPSGE